MKAALQATLGCAALVLAAMGGTALLSGAPAAAPSNVSETAIIAGAGPTTLVKAPSTRTQPAVPVTIRPMVNGFRYLVDGQPVRIRCVGYNPVLAREPDTLRAARYDRDFGMMQRAGVNTIAGWIQEEYDSVLLDSAARHGLGAILPFQADPRRQEPYRLDFTNPAVKQAILGRLTAWVKRYRTHPALRIWGLENEVIFGMPGPDTPNARAFASFLVEAADTIHRLDPHHPVIYREAEDVFIKPVADALQRDGKPRPWFIYGMNFYTFRMRDALAHGPSASLRQPLFISEFGLDRPGNTPKPEAYVAQWATVRAFSPRVLGGCAYVWTTAGPEVVDRFYGMTDLLGKPVDGTWAALAAEFRREQRLEERWRDGHYGRARPLGETQPKRGGDAATR